MTEDLDRLKIKTIAGGIMRKEDGHIVSESARPEDEHAIEKLKKLE